MPAYLRNAIDRAATVMPDAPREQLEKVVREAAAAFGHAVANDGQVYNPAEGAYRPKAVRVVPRDQRFASRRR